LARRTLGTVLGALLVVASLAACAAPSGGGPSATPCGRATPRPTVDPIAGRSLPQQVGQVFMVGTTAGAAQPITLGLISSQHLANVFLSGRSRLGVTGTAAVVAKLRAAVPPGGAGRVPLFVATDQEGGQVQVLQGPGFDTMPSGVQQGVLSSAALEQASTRWGAQLTAAGVNL